MDSVLSTVYYCCMGVGLLLPLLHVVLDFLDLDFDAGSSDAPLPFNGMALAFGVLVFGACGKIVLVLGGSWVFSLILGAILGILAFWALTRYVIRPLKRNHTEAPSIRDLRWKEGVIQLAVRPDFIGTVRVLNSAGSYVAYSAKTASWVTEELPVGMEVLVVEIDEEKKLCTVCPFDSYRKQLEQWKQSKGGL